MDLYFSPLACSMATRIALYEAGADARYIERDRRPSALPDGSDFLQDQPARHGADLAHRRRRRCSPRTPRSCNTSPSASPTQTSRRASGIARARLQQWLCFIGTELHKAMFMPLFDSKAPAEAKAYAASLADSRFAFLEKHLTGREFLLDTSASPTRICSRC